MKSLEELGERWPTVSLLGTATLLLLLTTVTDHGRCQTTGGVEGNKLLLILVGGCRWDYPDQDPNLRGFRRIAEEGTRAPDVTPIFPTNTYPNSYAVVTGLFAESHGFVQNMMYDPKYDDFFLMAPNDTASVSHWWNNAEPLWVTAERSGVRSALFWWDGCQVEIRGTKPTFCRKYKFVGNSWTSVNADTKDAILTAVELFDSGEIQLVQIYYEPIDFCGHKYGPDSKERKEAVRNIDSLLVLLQEEITLRELTDEVNIVVLSDHGMLAMDPDHINLINLQSKVDVNDIQYMVYYGASSMILPKDGKLEKLYNTLRYIPGLDVYLKDQIPERYHLRKSRLSLPLLLVAQRNFFIQGLDIPGKSIPTGSSVSLGSHGYDPEEVPEMKGIFFAKGPVFRKRHVSPPLQIVDIYNVLCGVLGIKAQPNNGSKTIFSDILISNDCSSTFECRYGTFCIYAVFSLHVTLFTSIFHT